MDQVKEYLGYAVKYRFWIVIGIASLLPLIGYFASAGAIEEETKKQADTVKASYEAVKKYASNSTPVNKQYKPLVEQKTEVLNADVNASWRKLFDRQAALLTWPEDVADRFPVWGPKWPEGQDPTVIREALSDYVESYEDYYQEEVYQTFRPFDYETGEGIVTSPPAKVLLRAPTFEVAKLPTLSEVWDTQRRFWVQHTVLDVIGKVNERSGAKDWPSASVKELLVLNVANEQAQDQKSIAQGKTVDPAPEITDPNAPVEEVETTAGGGAGAGMPGMPGMAQMMESMATASGGGPGMGPMGMGGGMGGQDTGPQEFLILESPNPDQAFIVPFQLAVYIEQDRIPDLLVEFQNSPMNVEILDFAMHKPKPHSVKKPEKGQMQQGYYGMGMMGMMGGMAGMPGMGMMRDMMEGGYGGGMGMPGMAQMMGQMSAMGGGMMPGMMPGMMGMGGGGAASVPKKKGEDVRQESLEKLKKAKKARSGESSEEEEKGLAKTTTLNDQGPDPYYNVVKVEIYGRARFYLPPPQEETPQSESEVAADGATDTPAEGDAATPTDGATATPADGATDTSAEGEAKAEVPQEPTGEAKSEAPAGSPEEEAAPQEEPPAPTEEPAPAGSESADAPQ